MLRFEPKRRHGRRATFTSQSGDTKMVVRIDGRDLIFVVRERNTQAFGLVRTLEVVDFDGKTHLLTTTKKRVSDFWMEGYAGLDSMYVYIDDLEPGDMKVI